MVCLRIVYFTVNLWVQTTNYQPYIKETNILESSQPDYDIDSISQQLAFYYNDVIF